MVKTDEDLQFIDFVFKGDNLPQGFPLGFTAGPGTKQQMDKRLHDSKSDPRGGPFSRKFIEEGLYIMGNKWFMRLELLIEIFIAEEGVHFSLSKFLELDEHLYEEVYKLLREDIKNYEEFPKEMKKEISVKAMRYAQRRGPFDVSPYSTKEGGHFKKSNKKRKTIKRKSIKRKSIKRKSIKRKSIKRKSIKRKSTLRRKSLKIRK
tara:strand:+ start:122 stop:736 length:615 start_codon:yes stop_codon:yes gene_type:complete